ncbi:hypothetical protein [Clostridium beijerinckii]|uniref:hypothetical protein n=1 Tax=Clostridium beijerinckii TaxID=1520 RepID=UPI002330B67C|nr:hypothetical protein [Clostridium beijerinckii]
MKGLKKWGIFVIIVFTFVGSYFFSHSTPEMSIRTYLLFHGYLTKALKTEIYMSNETPVKGKYYCKNPGIGPDFIAVEKTVLGLWYVDLKNSGGA